MFNFFHSIRKIQRISRSFGTIRNVSINKLVDINPDVQKHLSLNKPIVALESTIITHGMPYPYNLETALQVEDIVRREGSIPATIAVIDGRIKVGLTQNQLEYLANLSKSENIVKCSRRDLSYVLSKKLSGGTTVAGTLIIANMIGIKVFATGGIGGVHRDGHQTFDISADLIELGKTPVAVISSGIKSILDIPRTLEFLETQGVCVCSYQSPTLDFPAFYTRSSGCKVPYNLNNSSEAAEMIKSSLDVGLNSGILIGVPIPKENAISENLINSAISNALEKAKIQNVHGKNVTPFVLEAVSEITKGKSLSSNIALIKNNARIASKIAVKLHAITQNEREKNNYNIAVEKNLSDNLEKSDCIDNVPVVIGASILDLCLTAKDDFQLDGATYSVNSKLSGGGVGRNLAETIWKLYGDVRLISAIGDDEIGRNLKKLLPDHCTKNVKTDRKYSTSMCSVIFNKNGDCKLVLGDMEIHKSINPELIMKNKELLEKSPLIVMDSNVSLETMEIILSISKTYNKPVFFEPTDMRIADKPFHLGKNLTQQIKLITPNLYELHAISKYLNYNNEHSDNEHSDNKDLDLQLVLKSKEQTLKIAKSLLQSINGYFDVVLLTLGIHGIIVHGPKNMDKNLFDANLKYIFQKDEINSNSFYFMAPTVKNLINDSGAGDSFASGFISAALQQRSIENCVLTGFYAAEKSLQSNNAVPNYYFSKDDVTKYINLNAAMTGILI